MFPMRIPKYRPHSSGRFGFVEFKGERIRLPGALNSAESKAAYNEFLVAHVFKGSTAKLPAPSPSTAVKIIVVAFLDHARKRYPRQPGDERTEYDNCRVAVDPLLEFFGEMPVAQF